MTEEVMRALFDQVALLKTTGPQLPVAFPEGKTFEPPEDGKYLRVSFFPNVPRWNAMAVGKMDQGLLQISVIWPKKQGEIKPARVASQVMELFPKGRTFFYGATKVKIVSDPWRATAVTEDISVAIPVTIPWNSQLI